MGRRQYKRLHIALPVTVSGVDTRGNPFTQSATTVDISARGLRLRGLSCLRARGDPVQIKYKNNVARYRIAWIGEQSSSAHGQVGLEGIEEASFHLFADALSPDLAFADPRADTYIVPPEIAPAPSPAVVEVRKPDRRQQERRRHPRFTCSGTARIWENGNEHDIGARINEISFGGCYVEMMSPMRIGQGIRMELAVNKRAINLEGIVRTSQPNFGMGVEFTKMQPSEAEKLHRLIAELSGELPAEAQAPPAANLDTIPGRELGEALLRWFGSHDALTRQDFLSLIERLHHATEETTHA
jgi:c-di-GMP-binding flagellar brake protein YcgR